MKFDGLWNHVKENSDILAQNYNELLYVFNLMQGSDSYLEIGSAEGNSLYVLGHALNKGASITYVDYDESHTRPWREPKEMLLTADGYTLRKIKGSSHSPEIIKQASDRRYDCVLIDAGHSYSAVKQDAQNYASLADKYVFFHDIMLAETNKAFMEYVEETKAHWHKIIYDKQYGFGIIKV